MRRVPRAALPAAVLSTWLVCGWGSAAAGPAQAETGAVPAGDLPKVRLLEPGAEPRRALRYRLADMKPASIEMRMDMAMKMTMGSNATPEIQLPTMLMVMEACL